MLSQSAIETRGTSPSQYLVDLITKHLKGERVELSSHPAVRTSVARLARNPATCEDIKIKGGKKVAFRTTKELKLAV